MQIESPEVDLAVERELTGWMMLVAGPEPVG